MTKSSILTGSSQRTLGRFWLLVFLLGPLSACSLLPREANSPVLETQAPARVVALVGESNFRDLGGYATADGRTTKWGQIYRSGKLSDLTTADYETIKGLNLETVVDFRSDQEREDAPTKWQGASKPEIVDLPIGGNAADWSSDLSRMLRTGIFSKQEIRQTFIQSYTEIPIQNTAEYKALFDHILTQQDRPLLFHCTSGKDRTGIGAALLLSALGVPRETIMKDFLLTNEVVNIDRALPFMAKAFSARAGHEIDPEALRPLDGRRSGLFGNHVCQCRRTLRIG